MYVSDGRLPKPSMVEYDQSKPIRGRIVWEDGTPSLITYARYVNGDERRVDFIEVDGDRFERVRTCRMELAKGGCMYDVWRFTCCGYEHSDSRCDGGASGIPGTVCPNCGARVVDG